MPNSTLTTFDDLSEQIGKGVHDFSSHTFKLALAAAANAPSASADDELADITQISDGGGYSAGGYTLTDVGYSETGGTATFSITSPFTITASGGSVGPFRYLIVYNDTSTGDKLVGYLDYGSDLTLADGESLSITSASGLLTVTS